MMGEIIYKYKFGKRQLINILTGIGMIGFSIFMFFRFDTDTTQIVLISIFSVSGIIPLLITLHFFLRSKNVHVLIKSLEGLIEVNNNGINTVFKLEDINHIEIHEHKGLGFYEFDFDYAKYTFDEGYFCIITSFMADGYYIPEKIKPVIIKEFLPIIWKRSSF